MDTTPSIALLEAFLEAAPDAMLLVERGGSIAYANTQTEALFGYTKGELVQSPLEILVPARFADIHPGHRARYFEGPRPRPMGGAGVALYALRRDGSEFPAEISLSPLRMGDARFAMAAIRDVTSREQTAAALRRANEAAQIANDELRAFSSSVAHDLRAPLRSIRGFSEILLRDYLGPLDARGQGYLRRVDAAAERMGLLIEALLSLSRVTQTELRCERVSLSAIAHAVMTQLKAAQPDRSAEVVINPELSAVGDASLLRALFENLLGNAWKFTSKREGARIEVGRKEGDGAAVPAVFFVRDNGVGFNMAHADKLFAPFQRLHAASAFPGTGIGLATVQRIVQRHGGRIWAEGAVDQGATISFTLSGAGDSSTTESEAKGRETP